MFLVRLTRVINASTEKPWSRLLYVTWKKIPLSTPPSSVVSIELWITQWQPCRDRQSGCWANPATQSTQPGLQKIVHIPSQSRNEQNFFHKLCFKRRISRGLLRPLVCINIRVPPSQVYYSPSTHTPSIFLSLPSGHVI